MCLKLLICECHLNHSADIQYKYLSEQWHWKRTSTIHRFRNVPAVIAYFLLNYYLPNKSDEMIPPKVPDIKSLMNC